MFFLFGEKKMLPRTPVPADVCLILEGAYPFVRGGVSSWMHETIKMQDHLSFCVIAIASADASCDILYDLPKNVVCLETIRLQDLPEGYAKLSAEEENVLFIRLKEVFLKLQFRADLDDLHALIKALAPWRREIGSRLLLDSAQAWDLLVHMYQRTMPETSFLDYFWSWRSLFGGLFSVLLADIPPARAYHSFCTGYAGLLLARAHLETGRPCLLTEHGIYTNERRIEIAGADWLDDPHVFDLSVSPVRRERNLKDFWMDTFGNYARFCYDSSREIITLYAGNQEFQRMDGAPPDKMRVIANGIDFSSFSSIKRKEHPPTVALIGRVVPIKDIKTYIRAIQLLKAQLPDIRAFIMGPEDEDPDYAGECRELVDHLELRQTVLFTGSVKLEDYLGVIDVVVLTSLSEAQPLVVLEAGAAGIPVVATDVGACREMIMGCPAGVKPDAEGGAIVGVASAPGVAQSIQRLLTDKAYYQRCQKNLRARVQKHYSKEKQREAYHDLYRDLIGKRRAP